MEPETIIKLALAGKYEIHSVIGKGGMATVYKAIQTSLGRPVALKIVHQNLVHDDEFVHRFIREAQICASLNHPNIVTIYDVGSVDTVHYMAMEYLEGDTLRKLIQNRNRLSIEDTIRYIVPIAEVLDFMHHQGVIHRDVKSSNIFITKKGRPVLMDFGIVYSEGKESLSRDGSILGTPEYMSPEQIEGKVKIDGRSDIYSLGVILFECLTGQLPFHNENYMGTLHQVLHNAPPSLYNINSKVPVWLNRLVKACLEKDRDWRVQSGQELALALKEKRIPVIPFSRTQQETRKMGSFEASRKEMHDHNPSIAGPKKLNTLLIVLISAIVLLIVTIGFLILKPTNISYAVKPIIKQNTAEQLIADTLAVISAVESEPVIEVPNSEPEAATVELSQAYLLEQQKQNKIQAYLNQGEEYLSNKDYEEGIVQFKAALALDPSKKESIKRLRVAESLLADLKKQKRENILYHIKQGDELLKNNEFEDAIDEYEEAIALDPGNREAQLKLRNANDLLREDRSRMEAESRNKRFLQNLGISMVLVKSDAGDFYISTTEITQHVWREVMGTGAGFFKGDNLPVESVSWSQVQQFIRTLNQKSGMNFRLPSNPEWETAARGTSGTTKYSGSDMLSEVGWYEANSGSKTHPVMQKKSNALGLYDMSGNVWEWCSSKSIKGGSWISTSSQCSITNANTANDQGDYSIGFRVCRSVD